MATLEHAFRDPPKGQKTQKPPRKRKPQVSIEKMLKAADVDTLKMLRRFSNV
jgi:hypothetical protein